MELAIEVVPATATAPERQIAVLPGQVGASRAHPDLIWKAYVWDAGARVWRWDKTVRRSETAKRD
jgi:hypothetical protein